jgi:hypothetical protein
VDDVAITGVAPERKVSEGEHDRVVETGVVCLVLGDHVRLDIAGAPHSSAFWFEANPVFALVVAHEAGVVDVFAS